MLLIVIMMVFMLLIVIMMVLMLLIMVVMVMMLVLMLCLILCVTCLCKHLHLKVVLSLDNLKDLLTTDRLPIGCDDRCLRVQLLDLLYTELKLLRCSILAAA